MPLLALLLAPLATGAPPDSLGLDDVISVDTTTTPVYAFTLHTCDRVRAEVPDPRPPEERRSQKVVVTLTNDSPQTCLYKGVILKGFLEGTYKPSQQNPEGTGLFIAPGEELALRIRTHDPDAPRAVVQLQIAPGSGAILLKGLGPDDVAAREATKAP